MAAVAPEAAAENGAAQPEVDEIVVDGTVQLELFDFGGKRPTGAVIVLRGAAKLAEGQGYKKGTRVKFSGEAVVDDVGLKDKADGVTGQVVDCKARFGAKILDLNVESATPPAE